MRRAWWIASSLVLICAAVAGLMWWLSPRWPEFPQTQSKEPQVIVEVDRDYAYHIGDLVAMALIVRQMPGTSVDPSSLSVGGDFELATRPQIDQKELPDGSVCYRMWIKLQSFKIKPQLLLNATVGWSRGDNHRVELVIPQISLFTSNTWDGRPKLQEGNDPRVPVYWYTLRHVVPLGLASFLFVILLAMAVRNHLRSRQLAPSIDHARARVVKLLGQVRSGSCTKQEHLELDGLIRDHFGVGPIPASKLAPALVAGDLIEFLNLNATAVYAQGKLDEKGNAGLNELGERLLDAW